MPPVKVWLGLIDAFEAVKLRATKSAKTAAEVSRKLQRYREWMGEWPVATVRVEQLDELLEEKAPTADPYRLHRLLLKELFAYALGKGWRREFDGNPGAALLPPKLAREKKPKQRKRLSLDQYRAIYEQAPEWLQVAMDISLQTGLRRGDICRLKFEDYHEGCLHVIPAKTKDLPDPVAIKIKAGSALAKTM